MTALADTREEQISGDVREANGAPWRRRETRRSLRPTRQEPNEKGRRGDSSPL